MGVPQFIATVNRCSCHRDALECGDMAPCILIFFYLARKSRLEKIMNENIKEIMRGSRTS
jgi:hypothetical protein